MTSVGFFGMPGCGKSTVYRALSGQDAPSQYLGYDLKPHQAVVHIRDSRLDRLVDCYQSRSKVYATMEFVDIPGFDPSITEAKLKNSVLEHYRRCDALALVVNLHEAETVELEIEGVRNLLDELVLLGLVTVESALPRLEKVAQVKTEKEAQARLKLLRLVKAQLEEGVPVRRMELEAAERKLLREYALVSAKPVIAVLNLADEDFAKPEEEIAGMAQIQQMLREEGIETGRFSAALEAELAELDENEAREYMAEYGISEPSLDRFIRAAFRTLGLITFLTGSEKECRTWALRAGSTAVQAAGTIHTDMARGFIRAETIAFDDLAQYKNMAALKAAGKVRLEGKEYIVQDGDILNIRFNV